MRSIFGVIAMLALALPGPSWAQEANPTPSPAAETPAVEPPVADAASPATAPAAQATAVQDITIELNKLEAIGKACRGSFIIENKMPGGLQELTIEVVLIDKPGVIMRRVSLSFLDIRPGRKRVVFFDLDDLDCGSIGSLLLNSVVRCKAADEKTIEDCADRLAVRSRAEAKFEY